MSENTEQRAGVLVDNQLSLLAQKGHISSENPIEESQFQPASIDLRLGDFAYRLRASFLPGGKRTVTQCLSESDIMLHRLDLREGAVLETGCVYLVPLQEALKLPPYIDGITNPKSSTGRIDVFVRVITDYATAFDRVAQGYNGPLWVEICPRTFSILAKTNERLAQLRLKQYSPKTVKSVDLALDLDPKSLGKIVGFRARRHAPLLNLADIGLHDPRKYFEPLYAPDRRLVLDPGEFYILASAPGLIIEKDLAAEMVASAEDLGEFRAHYAGFFDPGFGPSSPNAKGARGVLEVRGRDVPFVLEHGQPVARLVYENLAAVPNRFYGESGSHYQGQGLKLSKLFNRWV
ncbi:MAG: dCTP deaminase [Hyphomonadaceae bacterium]|nr:MAG: dCTP deaminase [Hyphomonadaceae bacterium]